MTLLTLSPEAFLNTKTFSATSWGEAFRAQIVRSAPFT
jgi:hypothetical protein